MRQKRTRFKIFVEPAGLKDIPVLRLFMNYMYTCVAHFMNPAAFSDKGLDQCWNWDSETKSTCKAQGLLHALKSTQNVVAFFVAENGLEIIKPLTVKLQKRDQDVVEAYCIIDDTISRLKMLRETI